MYNSTNMCVASRHAAQPLVNLMLGDYSLILIGLGLNILAAGYS